MQQHVKLNDLLELDIKRMGINGEGIGYYERLAIFVDHALPGEKVLVRIKEVYPNRAVAELIKVINESKDRIDPFCPVYDVCGGCQTQHFNYEAMLEQKKDILMKSLDRYLGNYSKSIIRDTIGMDFPMHYRNKASLPFKKIDGKNHFGMYERGSNFFVPIEDCGIQHPTINEIFKTLTYLMDKYHIDSYDFYTQMGYLTHGVVRISENLEEVQVSLITVKELPSMDNFIQELIEYHPMVKSVYEVLQPDIKRQTFLNKNSNLLYGKESINENLGGYEFTLKPEAFFQLNTYQAHHFYEAMKTLAKLSKNDVVIDAYAGIAPISHYIHSYCKKVYAIEINEESALAAKASLIKNNIHNVEVIEGDFKDVLKERFLNKHIDVILFDPPRIGLGKETIDVIKLKKPSRIVYGSCNPSTLAKDLNELIDIYEITEIIPFDMFPYTSLVESVTLLELKKIN